MHPELSFYLFEYSVLWRSEVVKTSALLLPSLLGVYDRPNNQPTNKPTDMDRHGQTGSQGSYTYKNVSNDKIECPPSDLRTPTELLPETLKLEVDFRDFTH